MYCHPDLSFLIQKDDNKLQCAAALNIFSVTSIFDMQITQI